MAQARVPVFFAVNRYLRYKYFDVIWGYRPPPPPVIPPKTNLLNNLIYGASVFDINSRLYILEMNTLT